MTLAEELHAIDWDEALTLNALHDFESQRVAAVLRQMPIGTRVKWLQTPDREVFDAEGVVGSGFPSRWQEAVVSRKHQPCVWVRFTKHPALDSGRHVVGENFGMYIGLGNLEALP